MPVQVDHVRDLLLGLNALRDGLIDQNQLLAAVIDWGTERGMSLGAVLVRSGALNPAALARLEGLAEERSAPRIDDRDSSVTVAYEGNASKFGAESFRRERRFRALDKSAFPFSGDSIACARRSGRGLPGV